MNLNTVRLEDEVTREELESLNPAVGQLTAVQQNDVKVKFYLTFSIKVFCEQN